MSKKLNIKKLDIANTLESIRWERGLGKAEFAKKCDISAPFYSDILAKRKSLHLDTLEKICSRIGVPIDVFVFKAFREDSIKDIEHKKLIREIKPHLENIAKVLYIKDQA